MTFQFQKSPFLPQQRKFPNEEAANLSNAVFKAYIDIANRVNERVIGLYAPGFDVVTGKTFYLTGQPNPRAVLRRVVEISGTGPIPHGPEILGDFQFSQAYGMFFSSDTNRWETLPYVDVVSVTNQITLSVTSTDIILTPGAGSPPTVTRGTVVIEWLSPL